MTSRSAAVVTQRPATTTIAVPDRTVGLPAVAQILRERGIPEEVIEDLVMATEPNLLTLDEASARFGISQATLRQWLTRGRLAEKGRITSPAPGGGKVLVDEADVIHAIENPSKGGRPKTRHK